MPHVSVTIAGRHYRMACDAGQEEHLMRLARDIDTRILDLRGAFGEIGDQRLVVMAAVTIADELAEARARIRALESDIESQRDARASAIARIEASEEEVARTIDEVAERIERLTAELAPREKGNVGMG
ncbi:cell division protein ZapA [Xanthobacter tagetidis]|jgi:cell division protein ZapA|uniref:Cell division protein ZapA n=1 Tax=Xanthobacter tagetidis TaxID=60216 RepID=A0A3L7AGH5_9HYPH|nr:cell division protein ZapA [Xanthobacter tagetidis]MBB6306300.1 cell division protein ZapA [Xanthobacter tagetidis]RLP79573.1 cell division protein ZapA [Xanthobacter tagetidis]